MIEIHFFDTEAPWTEGGAVFAGRKAALSVHPSPFCCVSDLQSSQSPEEVLALNAAAIIANIKLQRQLSRRTSVPSETDSSARPQGTSGAIPTSLRSYFIIKVA